MADFLKAMISEVRKGSKAGVVTTVDELRENQFGIPLRHYAQQYLFGATGLRLQVFNSIAGAKESCKSSFLFDLMGQICADEEHGGFAGIGFLYELEQKISPTGLYSILSRYGDRAREGVMLQQGHTLESAMDDLNTNVIRKYLSLCPDRDVPLVIGLDSIGGAASGDTVEKLEKEGHTGKGYYDKAHVMKHFCENEGAIFSKNNIPVVVICINQEKESQGATPFGPPTKKVTGGTSQTFKEGHMISASKKSLDSGDGNLVYLRTTKTSFCDPRRIEVFFRWNKFGRKDDDAYESHFDWALASAMCIAKPTKGVDEIRDICNVSVSDKNLVTCPQLGLKSVLPEEFERALMADEKVLRALQTHQKIERLKDVGQFAGYVKALKSGQKEDRPEEKAKPAAKPAKAKAKAKTAEPQKESLLDGDPLSGLPEEA